MLTVTQLSKFQGQALKEEALFTSRLGITAVKTLIFTKLLFHNASNVQTRPNTGKDDD
jgi:hypothetical protein